MDTALIWFIGCIVIPLGIVIFGLTVLSQSIGDIGNIQSYKSNPLIKLGSKYYSWRPKNAIVLTKEKWQTIENGMAEEIKKAKKAGVKVGRRLMITEIENKISAAAPVKSPYAILGLDYQTLHKLEGRVKYLKSIYEPSNFEQFGQDFVLLAEAKIKEIENAELRLRNQITANGLK